MLLYRYMSLKNLWYVLDIVVNHRLHCAQWRDLNDPLEGYYDFYFRSDDKKAESALVNYLETNRDQWRIASFSSDPGGFLLWSHYADGHRGVALELNLDPDDPELYEITYSPFSYIFDEHTDTTISYPTIFAGKSEEWQYEKEWRVISKDTFWQLPEPCQKLLLGPYVNEDQAALLRKILPNQVKIAKTEISLTSGRVCECAI